MTESRPDPQALLATLPAPKGATRGRLKIWFGAAPGVGKTFAMLGAARRRAQDGQDVVVGIVESHGRAETAALLEGLETLPRRTVEHHGRTISDLDVDAALRRRPGLLIVDELAHTNIPGSRHEKRHGDVRELLDAGIDVWTTLNVQHLESLIDVVEKSTGVVVRETVPDEVFDLADDVELVDLAPEVLLERLRAGKVYLPETAERALEGYFRAENLTALRELALRRTARFVDARLRDHRRAIGDPRAWPVAERMLVCVGPSPLSATLLRTAHRMASATRADLLAVHVQPPGGDLLDPQARSRVFRNLRLAESLGAKTLTLESHDPAAAIVAVARQHGVARIVVGKSGRPRLVERVCGSFVQDLIRASGDIDVLVIRGAAPERPSPAGEVERDAVVPQHGTGSGPRTWLAAASTTAASIAVALLAYHPPDLSVEALVLLLGVVLVALRHTLAQVMGAALVSALAFNFLFTEPRFSFAITEPTYVVAFGAMLVCGSVIGSLVIRVREQSSLVLAREQETAAMYSLTRELGGLASYAEIAHTAAAHAADAALARAAVLLPSGDGAASLAVVTSDGAVDWLSSRDLGVARWVWENGRVAGAGSSELAGVPASFLPIRTTKGRAGVLVVQPRRDGRVRTARERSLLETLCGLTALAIERLDLLQERQIAMRAADRERLRSSLLSSVSHDLRTPLATICGAASAMVDVVPDGVAPAARELAHSILDEARRLEELIGNLVFATRLESGRVDLRVEWTAIEDVIASAVRRGEERMRSHPLEVRVTSPLPLVEADAPLLQQALSNVLDNVVRHTPAGTRAVIETRTTPSAVVLTVRDEGPGPRLSPVHREGLGLGLSICRGILAAHGGSVTVGPGPQGVGTEVAFTIPRPPRSPQVPRE
ncbi:MAG: sensor histidine kinase KdpD [Planctomycetota bacterium]